MRLSTPAIGCALCVSLTSAAVRAQECEAPRVLIVLDKSSSMLGETSDGQTKWEAAEGAIGSVTAAHEDGIDFGLMIFPDPDECGPGSVFVDCAPDTAGEIADALGAPPPEAGNWTPMAQSLAAAAQYDPLSEPGRRGYVLLVTDGWQWCSPYDAATRFTPVDEVAALQRMGITTYVVGFGDGVDVLTLNRSANAGGAPRPGCDPDGEDMGANDLCYYQADDAVSLEEALGDIAADVTEEVCDGTDNDCDGQIDEGFDDDGDGAATCGDFPDCDDGNRDVRPFGDEECNAIDDDCDGVVDPGCTCLEGDRRACGQCGNGEQECAGGAWSDCDERTPDEACNGFDDDCDGDIDEWAPCREANFICQDGECVDPSPDDPDDGDGPPNERGPDGDADGDDSQDDWESDWTPDEGDGDDAVATGSPPASVDGGCACHTSGASDARLGSIAAMLLALALRRRAR